MDLRPHLSALFVLAFIGCGGGDDGMATGSATIGPEGGAVASEDGVLTLTVPPGAVAAATDFSITALPESEWPAELAGADPVGAVYVVEPEGTQFASPAKLTWSFAAAPASTLEAGRPKLLFAFSRSAAGVIEPELETGSTHASDGSLTVVATVAHLSEKFLTAAMPGAEGAWNPVGSVNVELGGGAHAVDVPWQATTLRLDPVAPFAASMSLIPTQTGPIENTLPAGWTEVIENEYPEEGEPEAYSGYVQTTLSLNTGVPWMPTSMPEWQCTGAGTGEVGLGFNFRTEIYATLFAYAFVYFSEPVECYEREQKVEFTAEVAALGESRISDALTVPGEAMTNLADTAEAYGYRIPIPPGGTVRICVTASMPTAVNYYPQYPPGFEYVDGEPGCTDITNLDPDNPNVVLLKLTGAGSPNDVTVTTLVP